MNVSFQRNDNLTGTLSVSLEKADYEPKVDEQIKSYRKKAQIPGFRPGTAPVSMLKKMYGKSFIADEVNKLASEKMFGYLKDNDIDILGQPLLSIDNPSEVDFDHSENFTFNFDLGLSPSFEFNISAKDSITKYVIEVDEKEVENEINNLCRRYGILEKIEESTSESDSILVILTELDADNQAFEGGVTNQETTIIPELIKDEATKNLFMNSKTGDKIVADIKLLFNDNETVMASATGIPKEGLHDLNPNFEVEIKNIQKFSPAEVGQELFDKIFGEGLVTDEETFKSKLKENLEIYFNSESEHHLEHELDHFILEKHSFTLPDSFLKRWLINSHPDAYNEDNADEKYEKESGALRYQLIQEKAIELFKIEISEDEFNQTALGYSASLFRNYGISNPDFRAVQEYTEKQKKEKKFTDKVREIAIQRAVVNQIKNVVTIVEQKTTVEGFYEMIKNHNHEHHH